MSIPTAKDIDNVVNALESFYNHIVEDGQFSLKGFINFMESKFTEAGYRTPPR